jgi:peptidyl-prolyl cis-trans isomerase B (cyclophilin B)
MNTFNEFYYSFSPTIADLERENPVFREAVKIAITPMISTLSLMEYADSENSVITIGVSLIILNGLMYFGIPAAVIVGVRKL